MMGERGVPKPAAIIIVDEGYSKGTTFCICNDEVLRKTAAREAAHAAEQAKAGAA
jgi:hypothetical protein